MKYTVCWFSELLQELAYLFPQQIQAMVQVGSFSWMDFPRLSKSKKFFYKTCQSEANTLHLMLKGGW